MGTLPNTNGILISMNVIMQQRLSNFHLNNHMVDAVIIYAMQVLAFLPILAATVFKVTASTCADVSVLKSLPRLSF